MYQKYLILLCISIIIFCIMSSYKIETFVNLSQTTVASDIPQSPDDFLCYNYIKKNIDWDIDNYNERIKRMISSMRTGLANRKSDLATNNPYTDSCVVPKEHMNLFGISDDCKIQDHQLKKLDGMQTPNGCTVDFRDDYKDEERYKDLLTKMEYAFNEDYIKQINALKAEIAQLEDSIKSYEEKSTQLDGDIASVDFKLKDNCDNDIINHIKETFVILCVNCNDYDLKLSCSGQPNSYNTTKARYLAEHNNYLRTVRWLNIYQSLCKELNKYNAVLSDDIKYFEALYDRYKEYI